MSNRKQSKGFLLGALAGSIAGSVAALLLAPKAGKELRGDIADGAHKAREQAARTANQVGETTGRIAKQAREQAVQFADKTKLTVNSLKLKVTGSEETQLVETTEEAPAAELPTAVGAQPGQPEALELPRTATTEASAELAEKELVTTTK